MIQATTHDKLFQFAADKLGRKIAEYKGYWYDMTETTSYSRPFSLTSFDLMGKGMGACPLPVTMFRLKEKISDSYKLWRIQVGDYEKHQTADGPHDLLPTMFWECWYRQEKGTS